MNPLGLHLSIGVSGSGKTYGLKKSVYAAALVMPIIVIDRMAEWDSAPHGVVARGFASVDEAIDAFKKQGRIGLAVVRDSGDVAVSLDKACEWAIKNGPRGVACSEAHRAAPNAGALPPHIEICATQWRHHNVGLWLDTQRLPLLSRTLTEQSGDLKLYAIVGDSDLAVIRQTWGRDLVTAVSECAKRYANGEPGWHVPLSLVRTPPYRIERDK